MRVVSCAILILGYEESASLGALTEIMKHNTLLRPIRYSQPRYASGELRQFHDGVDMEPYTSTIIINLLTWKTRQRAWRGLGPWGQLGPQKIERAGAFPLRIRTYTRLCGPLRTIRTVRVVLGHYF